PSRLLPPSLHDALPIFAGRDVLAVVIAADAARQIPRVVHTGRDLVLVVVLQNQLQALVRRRAIARGAGLPWRDIEVRIGQGGTRDRKSTRLNSSHQITT